MFTASFIISISPGAGAVATINSVLNHGFKRSYATIIGLQVGYLTQIIIVSIGLGGIIAASPTLYNIIKWLGVLYLIYLGITQIFAFASGFKCEKTTGMFKFLSLFIKACLINLTNPKATIFLLAFIPQFLSANKPQLAQLWIICLTLICVDFVVMSGYSALGSTMRKYINSSRFIRIQNRITGTALIIAAIFLAQSGAQ
jgi:homoserine/homoserine lactone efflux protein